MTEKPFDLSKEPIHPYLFALYPALSFLSYNASQVVISQTWRTFIASLLLVCGIRFIFNFLTKSKERSALISSLIILLLLSQGNLYELLYDKKIAQLPLNRAGVLVIASAVVLILNIWTIWHVLRRVDKINGFLNVVSIIAVLFPLVSLLSFYLMVKPTALLSSMSRELDEVIVGEEKVPDIYYIILDEYGRSDFLWNYYGIDNSDFQDFLYENGFDIAESSHSNYCQTALSLSSSLNYEYLDQILSEDGRNSANRQPLDELIRENRLVEFLKKKGYTFITFSSGYDITEIEDADIFIDTSNSIFNNFEKGFLVNTSAMVWIESIITNSRRNQIENTIAQLGQASKLETGTPRFIFAHILLPHPPFAFGPNGECVPITRFSQDGHGFNGTPEEYVERYAGQLIYLNKQMKKVITQILENSESDPIIVLQGDHGPGAFLKWETTDQPCFQERLGILSAYHLPGGARKKLYPSITPVNTFRLILNEYFDEEYPLLEDRVFISKWSSPYQFVEVTTKADQCSEIRKQ